MMKCREILKGPANSHLVFRDLSQISWRHDFNIELGCDLLDRARVGESIAHRVRTIHHHNVKSLNSFGLENSLRSELQIALSIVHCFVEQAPDPMWFSEFYSLTNNHWICLADHGWLPADSTGDFSPEEILIQVNAPNEVKAIKQKGEDS